MPVQEKILVWWHARSDRERKILLAWSVSAALLLLWFALLSPLFQRMATLEQRVPQLEAQLNRMRTRPVDAPRAASTGGAAGADLRSTLYGLLAERKLSAELRSLSNSRVEMRLPELPMKEALDMLSEYTLPYTDEELRQLATTESGMGEIGPGQAQREINRRAIVRKRLNDLQ